MITPFKDLLMAHATPLSPIPTGLSPSGKLDRPAACALLDIYGTLIISDSGDIHSVAPRQTASLTAKVLLEKYGFPHSPLTLTARLEAEIRKKHAELRAQGVDHPEVRIERIWSNILQSVDSDRVKAFAAEFEFLTHPVYPMPHLRELLAGLRQRHIRMGIISNAQFYTPCLFEYFLGTDLKGQGFSEELLLFSYSFGRAKPSLFLFEKAKSRLKKKGVPANRVLYVGNDMLNDVLPAGKVGFKTALFAGDARSLRLRSDDPRCRGVKPDLIVTDLIQILGFV